jgi:serine/threonine protein kinase
MSLQLVVVAGPDKGKVFTLNPGPDLMLGRSAQANYQLNDPRVSRNHCQLLLEGDQPVVICNGGSGGTLVNRKPIQRYTLKPGDVLQVGDTQLRLQIGDFPIETAREILGPGKTAEEAPAAKADRLESLSGQKLTHYDIGPVIGKGSTSVVFHATDTKDNRPVALKVLLPEFAGNDDEMQRFIRSMKTVLPLRHPNIVTVYAAGKTGAYCWVAMEFIAGENLTQVIQRIGVAGMLDWRHAFKAAVQIGRALAYAHGQQIIHRNVTPKNILRDATNQEVKLGDLMKAKALEGALAKQITRPGELIGDVTYMSPERTRGMTDVDGRSDLYGLGATCYALLTGRPPFEGSSLVEKITRIRQDDPVKPTKFQMSIPSAFEGAILRCLAKRPEDRYQSAEELVKELTRVGKYNGVSV